jgi:hypothetical protein
LKEYVFPPIPGTTQVAGSDVSSEIKGSASNNASSFDNSPLDFYSSGKNSSESPFAPSEVGSSISSEEPLNTLPEC